MPLPGLAQGNPKTPCDALYTQRTEMTDNLPTKKEVEDYAEVGFLEWFNGNYGKFSCRSEWFYGDCEVENEKIRKDLVYNWVRSAYVSGYELGRTLDELAHKTPQGTPDAL